FLERAQDMHPTDFWLNMDLANALLRRGRAQDAVGYYRAVLAIRPKASAAHNNLGLALKARKDFKGAIAAFKRAITLDSKMAKFHNNKMAKFHNNKMAKFHNNLGVALYDQHDLKGAIAAYQKAIYLEPKLAQIHYNLGLALAGKPDLPGAIAQYNKAIDIDSEL